MTSFLIAICVSVISADVPVEAEILVKNVSIHDGSGQPARLGNIAIRGDQIVGVGQFESDGNPRLIDGSGLVAAPGFIDLHNHSDDPIIAAKTRSNRNFLLQGCTTVVTG